MLLVFTYPIMLAIKIYSQILATLKLAVIRAVWHFWQ